MEYWCSVNPLEVSAGGTFTVTATDMNGCMNTDSVVVVQNTVTVDAGLDVAICPGDTASLAAIATGTAPLSYQWSPIDSLTDATIAEPMAFPDMTTTYLVTVTGPNGSTAVDSVTVTVYPETSIELRNDDDFELGEDTEFEVRQRNTTTTIVDYQWSSIEFLTFTSADSSTAIFAPDVIGIDYLYSVTVTDSNGCTDAVSYTHLTLPTKA